LNARSRVLHRSPSSLRHRLGTFADSLSAFTDRGCSRGSSVTHRLAGSLGGIPSALGYSLGTLGSRLDGFASFFDGLLHVLLGLITSGQTERGRRHNKEVWFHSPAKVENNDAPGKHIFPKIH
jgi:hypothetical protein